jgi:hypothetical protein
MKDRIRYVRNSLWQIDMNGFNLRGLSERRLKTIQKDVDMIASR